MQWIMNGSACVEKIICSLLFPMMHHLREIRFKLGEMDEDWREEAKVSKIMTLLKSSDCADSCSEMLVQVNQCRDANKELSAAFEVHTSFCVPEDNPGDLRTEMCPLSPGSSGCVKVKEVPFPAAGGDKGLVQDPVNIRQGSPSVEKVGENSGSPKVGSGTAAESNQETNPPLSDLARQEVSECRTCDDEIARKGREEGRVDVFFSGSVTQDSCCRFVCELLKCVLYQRQQLPMTYDQMVFCQKQQHKSVQPEETRVKKSTKTSGSQNWHRCQRTLQELDNVLGNLEVLFSLSHVPRVLFMLGGSTVLPTELYEVNMEALVVGGAERSLRTSSCLRQLFRSLFVADLLSDVKPVRLMATTVMVLAHRNCGISWFKPKVDFKVPTRVKKQVISLASDTFSRQAKAVTRDCEDYIWFQTPVTVKGFCK